MHSHIPRITIARHVFNDFELTKLTPPTSTTTTGRQRMFKTIAVLTGNLPLLYNGQQEEDTF